ncbi:hypothetical protein FGO68_gene17317 [Halteria grandinella]|uniref:Bulb-type lectin domain-containing protein n=1 Tax=Halteria grandinella TaxID=5974 RepID=A0A8J8T2N2_HALGN|nr:hypothetical protein FGO68_gene17317 [Halteria grandinella]
MLITKGALVILFIIVFGLASAGNTLKSGNCMNPYEQLMSTNECFKFIYQSDGNIVIYAYPFSGNAIWSLQKNWYDSMTRRLCMQSDGNFVSYESTSVLWNSGTAGKGNQPYTIVMQDDGNLCIYDSIQKLIWQSNSPQRVIGTCKATSSSSSSSNNTTNSQNVTIVNIVSIGLFLLDVYGLSIILGILIF